MSTIWSSLARKRSLCPDCRRSFGRMKAPVVALKQPGNHGPHAGSICQKICPQRPKPGKYDYFAQPESYSRSGAWEFFTENPLVILELRELETAGRVLGL